MLNETTLTVEPGLVVAPAFGLCPISSNCDSQSTSELNGLSSRLAECEEGKENASGNPAVSNTANNLCILKLKFPSDCLEFQSQPVKCSHGFAGPVFFRF